jgi:acetylornithine/succinyldiaminopimelate/putrescine aminotransferase
MAAGSKPAAVFSASSSQRHGLIEFFRDRGEGAYVFDISGKRYLDGIGGLWCVNMGYGREEIIQAMVDQARRLVYFSPFVDTTNVPAAELAHADLLDAFASDYVPRSLIECAFAMTGEAFGWSLPRAIALVTATPAKAAQMSDRGVIDLGRRADLLRVRNSGGLPVIRGVWVEGQRVA